MEDNQHFTQHDVQSYDQQWSKLDDFIRYNPGSRHRRRLIQSLLERFSAQDIEVIDAGCGLGFTVTAIAKTLPTARITGVDFSQVAIFGAAKKYPEIQWRQMDLLGKNPNLLADIVVCTEVVEHVEDYGLFLRNIVGMVKTGGSLILTTQSGKVHQTEVSVGHVRHFHISKLCGELEQLGMQIQHRQTWGWPGYVCLKYMINLKSDAAMKKFGNGRYGTIDKLINYVAYCATRLTSLNHSSRGSQIVILAHKPLIPS